MRTRLSSTACVLACAVTCAWPTETRRSVPAPFRGEWEVDGRLCGTGEGDGRLVVSAGQLEFYESIGPVRAVIVETPLDVTVVAELSGEGETWLERHRFRLSRDHRTLEDAFEGGSVTRHRCDGKAA